MKINNKLLKIITKIIITILTLPIIICYPYLAMKIWFPKQWELAKKEIKIKKMKIEKEYQKLMKEKEKNENKN